MKIGIIGYGVVGKAAANTLKHSHELVLYDKYQDLDKFSSMKNCDMIFVMVPTPFNCEINMMDVSSVAENLNKLVNLRYDRIVIIKSTIPPGTSDAFAKEYNLDIVFNPEFLRESTTPYEDFANQDIVVIGSDSESTFSRVKEMFEKVLNPKAVYHHTSRNEAEMIKISQNTMLASRVSLANMIFDACQEKNINYDKVKKIAFDSFEILGPHMSQVPGPDGKRGFGGKCLPKDIRTFSSIYNSELLKSIISYNETLRNDLDKFLIKYKAQIRD